MTERDQRRLRCPNCGTLYATDEALRALLENDGFCVSPRCGCDLMSEPEGDDEDDAWFDFFTDGRINGKV